MSRYVGFVAIGIGGLVVLAAAGPLLLRLLHGAVPVIAVGGVVLVVMRLVWYFTSRY